MARGDVDAATVATVPGLEAAEPDPGFAGWECDWESPTSDAVVNIYYVAAEVPRPLGNQLNDHLIRELIRSATLVPTDLHRLDDWADG